MRSPLSESNKIVQQQIQQIISAHGFLAEKLKQNNLIKNNLSCSNPSSPNTKFWETFIKNLKNLADSLVNSLNGAKVFENTIILNKHLNSEEMKKFLSTKNLGILCSKMLLAISHVNDEKKLFEEITSDETPGSKKEEGKHTNETLKERHIRETLGELKTACAELPVKSVSVDISWSPSAFTNYANNTTPINIKPIVAATLAN